MAERKRRTAWMAGAAVLGAAAGIVLERTVVGRARERPDPEAGEPLGLVRGAPIGPIESFDGTMLHAEVSGSGHTLVMAHGYSLDLTTWHYQIRDLSNDHRLLLYDQRGHGRSRPAKSGDWSLDALARDLETIVRAAGEAPVVVVAHSMGGMAALKLCELHPELLGDRILGFVLVSTTAADVVGGMIPGLPRRLAGAVEGLQEVLMRAIVSLDRASVEKLRRRASDLAWLAVRGMGFGPGASPSQVAFVEKLLAQTPVDTWFDLLPAMTGMDLSPVLSTIDVPVLVVVGSADRLTPPSAAERMASSLKDSELVRISGAGHCPMIEAAPTFNARLRLFCSSLPWPERAVAPARPLEPHLPRP